jgi:hypothetical protein
VRSSANEQHWCGTLIEDKFMSNCFDKTEYSSWKTLYPTAQGWSKSQLARQVAQWVSGFDFCCMAVQLRHASLIAITGADLGRNWLPKNSTEDLSSISAQKVTVKEGLA